MAIPAALVGGTAISLTGTVIDNMTLMSGGGSVNYGAPANIALNYNANSTISPAGTYGTLNKTATVTLSVPWLISDLQTGNTATGGVPTAFNIRGTDEVSCRGGPR